MDLLAVGDHCSVASCNVNDLLPITCTRCHAKFCREHSAFDRHECAAPAAATPGEASGTWSKRSLCAFDGCEKRSLSSAFNDTTTSKSELAVNDALCPTCSGAFCVTHRYADAHKCKGPSTTEPILPGSKAAQVETAKAILAKNFPEAAGKTKVKTASSSASPTSKKAPKDPAKLAKFKAVEVIKMRHKAIPGDPKDKNTSVPLDRRLHVFVTSGTQATPVLLWFRKELVGGRVLDMLATRFSLTKNPTQLVVLGEDDTEAGVQLDKPLGDQISDGDKLAVRPRA